MAYGDGLEFTCGRGLGIALRQLWKLSRADDTGLEKHSSPP